MGGTEAEYGEDTVHVRKNKDGGHQVHIWRKIPQVQKGYVLKLFDWADVVF
jgi:hypothetical protein